MSLFFSHWKDEPQDEQVYNKIKGSEQIGRSNEDLIKDIEKDIDSYDSSRLERKKLLDLPDKIRARTMIVLVLLFTSFAFSQKNYMSVGTGAFFNSPLADTKNMLGATIEYGRVLNNGMSVGYAIGYYCLTEDKSFSEIKLYVPLYDFGKYNFSVGGGAGYFHSYNDILLEYNLNVNAKLSYNYALGFTLSKTSGLGSQYTSLNIGLTKNF